MSATCTDDGAADTIMRGWFPATDAAVSVVLKRLDAGLAAAGMDDGPRGDVLLAMGEILNNIVEHSVCGLADAEILLDVAREPGRILVETADKGRPLPPSLLSSAELPAMPDDPEDIAALPEGGFGWFIVHALAQDMVYEREGGVNRLSFHFPA